MSPKPWRFSCAIDTLPRKSSCGDDGSLLETVGSNVLEESDKISSSDCVTPALPCKYCSKQFKTKNSLSSHTSLNHGEERQKTEKKSMTGISRDINRNLLLLESLSDSSGNLLNADIITREIFKTGVQPEEINEEENFQAQLDEIGNILPDNLTSIRPVKRKSFPNPVNLKARLFRAAAKSSKRKQHQQGLTDVDKNLKLDTYAAATDESSDVVLSAPKQVDQVLEFNVTSSCDSSGLELTSSLSLSHAQLEEASSVSKESTNYVEAREGIGELLKENTNKNMTSEKNIDVSVVQSSFVKYSEPESIIIDILVTPEAVPYYPVLATPIVGGMTAVPTKPVVSSSKVPDGERRRIVLSPDTRHGLKVTRGKVSVTLQCSGLSRLVDMERLNQNEHITKIVEVSLNKIGEVSTPVAILSSTDQTDNTAHLDYPTSYVSSSSFPPSSSSSSHLPTRPKRSCSSRVECPSCGQLSRLLVHDFCCDSCVAAQEQLLRIKKRKIVG